MAKPTARDRGFFTNSQAVTVVDSDMIQAETYFHNPHIKQQNNHRINQQINHYRYNSTRTKLLYYLIRYSILVTCIGWIAYTIRTYIDSSKGLSKLEQHVVPSATHDSDAKSHPDRCHPGTRVGVLDEILSWGMRPESNTTYPILWLYGYAGTGKSAIAQTIAEELSAKDWLAASFFFSSTGERRKTREFLVPTLANQLTRAFPGFYLPLGVEVHKDHTVLSSSLRTQLHRLITIPLKRTVSGLLCTLQPECRLPKVIVIDGLDELESQDEQRNVLKELGLMITAHNLPIRLLLASRPELHIQQGFKQLSSFTQLISLDHERDSDVDIEIYIRDKFREVLQTRSYIDPSWPHPDDISNLVDQCSGRFIYAKVAMRYILADNQEPKERLRVLLRATRGDPYASLDKMYHHIFSILPDDTRNIGFDTLAISKTTDEYLAMDIEYSDTPPQGCGCTKPVALNGILDLPKNELTWHLQLLHSVLSIERTKSTTDCTDVHENCTTVRVWPIHKSIHDYLLDPNRSGSFHLSESAMHTRVAARALYHLNLHLEGINGMHPNFIWMLFWQHLSRAAPDATLRNSINAMLVRHGSKPVFQTLPSELMTVIVKYLEAGSFSLPNIVTAWKSGRSLANYKLSFLDSERRGLFQPSGEPDEMFLRHITRKVWCGYATPSGCRGVMVPAPGHSRSYPPVHYNTCRWYAADNTCS